MASEQQTVLIVDDEQNILSSFRRLLRKEGYEVITMSSGPEALSLLKENAMAPSVIVSDYRMPGMNGVEFLSHVRTLCPDTIRIILSGYADADMIHAAINEGQIYRFIAKPWDDEEVRTVLRSAVKQYVESRNARTVLGRVDALQKEMERVGIILDCSEPAEIATSSFHSVLPSETGSENAALRVWQNVFNSIPAAIIGVDGDGLIVLANRSVQQVLRVAPDLLLGNVVSEVLPDELVQLILPVAARIRGGTRATVTIQGTPVRVRCAPITGVREHETKGALLLAFAADETF
ncbi:MAG: response regulator [Chloroflexi bacterium]|nr:response regulator [Chloroflexota bacterium]